LHFHGVPFLAELSVLIDCDRDELRMPLAYAIAHARATPSPNLQGILPCGPVQTYRVAGFLLSKQQWISAVAGMTLDHERGVVLE
jgi:hypothetical protein